VNCRLCNSRISNPFSEAELLGHNIKYFECAQCEYVQTEEPFWLADAYASSINLSDTGIMYRNLSNVNLVLATLALIQNRTGKVVDYAGGYGFLVRLLRDRGVDALWADPYSQNLVARGFEYEKQNESAVLVTAFEAYEHFVKPVEEMRKLLSISSNLLLTTTLTPLPTPRPSDWWYYGLDHGQHIGFYRVKTLEYLATEFNLHLISDGQSIHFFSKNKYSNQIWKILILFSKFTPFLFRFGLKSKTWTDNLQITQSRL
jgi:hypothetical protein